MQKEPPSLPQPIVPGQEMSQREVNGLAEVPEEANSPNGGQPNEMSGAALEGTTPDGELGDNSYGDNQVTADNGLSTGNDQLSSTQPGAND